MKAFMVICVRRNKNNSFNDSNMKSNYLNIIIAFMAAAFTLTACEKSDDNQPNPQQEQPSPSPVNPSGDGENPDGGGEESGGDDTPQADIDGIHNEQTDQPAYVKAFIDI